MKEVTVIIPFYNLGKYLDEAVLSVENQSLSNWELIISNDGSSDLDSIESLNKYRQKYTVIDKENTGLANTRNVAIEISRTEFIVCLDADDVLEPTYIEELLRVIKNNNELGFVTSWVQLFEGSQSIWETSKFDKIKLLKENCIHVASLFRKEAWKQVGGYDEKLIGYQDWNFWLGLVAKGYKWEVVEKCLFNYRVREQSMIQNSDGKRREILSEIIKNHYQLYQEMMLDLILSMDEDKQNLLERIRFLEGELDEKNK